MIPDAEEVGDEPDARVGFWGVFELVERRSQETGDRRQETGDRRRCALRAVLF